MLQHCPYKENEPLSKYSSLRIGGSAQWMAFPESLEHLQELRNYLLDNKQAFSFLGNGSNLLIPDDGFPGWVIRTSSLSKFMSIKDFSLSVGAANLNSRVIRFCKEKEFSGLEFLIGVPGSIGGAVKMNAGTQGISVSDSVEAVKTFCFRTGVEKIYKKEELGFSYRQQHFMQDTEIVLEARFSIRKSNLQEIEEKIKKALLERKEAQPLDLPSCGSVFKNPKEKKAWKLIDEAGLRGQRKGDAQISEKHSNFIVNHGKAAMEDVLFLIKLAKHKVYEQTGISLEEEVQLLKPIFLS